MSTRTKPRKRVPIRVLRFRKNDPEHNLLAAAQAWLRANGGEALVIGGIGIMREPFAPTPNFSIIVRVTGRAPSVGEAIPPTTRASSPAGDANNQSSPPAAIATTEGAE